MAELVQQGVAASRLNAVGHGQDKPVSDNATKKAKLKPPR